jgi:hypothetical protein
MKNRSSGIFIGLLVFTCVIGSAARANASLVAAICNDLACSGGDDLIVLDNSAGDTIGALGGLSFSTSAFGFGLLVNTAQSKPLLGSAAVPQLDLTFTATTLDSTAHSAFLYVSDTDFIGPQSVQLSLGGTNTGDSGTVTGRSWGGTSNTALQFSGANLLNTVGPLSGPAYAGSASGTLTPTVTPYSLTIGVALNRTTPGTTTGDLNLASSPVSTTVPEPSSLLLGALGMVGAGFTRRRR